MNNVKGAKRYDIERCARQVGRYTLLWKIEDIAPERMKISGDFESPLDTARDQTSQS